MDIPWRTPYEKPVQLFIYFLVDSGVTHVAFTEQVLLNMKFAYLITLHTWWSYCFTKVKIIYFDH